MYNEVLGREPVFWCEVMALLCDGSLGKQVTSCGI